MVSVVIPVYNAEPYLIRCVDSLLRQTYSSIEIVLVDDGSTDSSSKICDDLANKDARVRVVHQQNQGASIARKVGIGVAKGEWLAFVDSDDIVEDDYIERLYNATRQFNTVIAACDQLRHVEGTDVVVDKTGKPFLLDKEQLHKRFFRYDFWGFWGKIYHHSVFEDIYFPEYTINEDYVVMAQLFNKYKQMTYLPMGLYHYMTHGESLSHQKLSQRMFDEYYNKKWVVGFYMSHDKKYVSHAEAQLVETCIKLVGRCKGEKYNAIKNEMRHYLQSNMMSIIFNMHLLPALKLEAVKRCL